MSRGRKLQDDERALWDAVMRDVRRPRVRKAAEPAMPRKPEEPKRVRAVAVKPVVPVPPKKAPGFGLDGSTAERLRKGKIEPDATIDLHGLTQDRAHLRLSTFIAREHEKGSRCIRVITGMGSPGVLRVQVPRWLQENEMRSAVAGVQAAHQRHGGGGAIYVYLKRKRR